SQQPPSASPLTGSEPTVTFDTQRTQFSGRWRGTQIVFDSERSPRHYSPPTVPEDTCPSLVFESRFESGNLRQARRVGMFEYELVLRTDLYTKRHTQWFYFRVQNARPGIVYKFVIVNLLKSSSLYGEGMKPLCYSEKSAQTRGLGWHRAGHHIRYSRNATRLQSALLQRDMAYYQLEWQMDFPHESDSCYLAHCYPYTYSDLRSDLAGLQRDQLRRRHAREEILCETRAGNACFLLTVTDPDVPDEGKHGVVVTARVHPGEANSSWMMKGLIDFLTGDGPEARELRKHFIFKIVPMLNPDGVIVGNYRTSLAGRDLNRNYRHPRKETFPTVYHTKAMLESFAKERPVALYCDLHGHSRKSHVFMYGCDSQYRDVEPVRVNAVRLRLQPEAFLNERLFPWLVSRCAPGLFSFHGCRFNIRRCKEATGRVVMWRQEDSRHFNTEDLETMGGSLASALWQYQQVKSDTTRQSQVVVDMTFDLVLNVLNERGVDVERQLSLVDKKTAEANQESANVPDADKESTMQLLKSALQDGRRAAPTPPGESSDARMRCLLDRLSLQTMGDCAGILRTLGIDGAEESDSSDSDSESEPEMPPEPPTAAEKRKRVGGAAAAQHRRDSKEVADAAEAGGSRTGSNQKKNWEEASSRVRIKQYPMFVNKYAGRSNHGIPDGLKPAPLEERRAAAAAAVMLALWHLWTSCSVGFVGCSTLSRRTRQPERRGHRRRRSWRQRAAESDRDRELDFMAQRMASAARPFHAAGLPPSKHLLRDRRQSDSNGRSGQSQKSRASIGGPWPAQGTTGQRSSAAAALTEQPAEFATAERSRPNRKTPFGFAPGSYCRAGPGRGGAASLQLVAMPTVASVQPAFIRSKTAL
uniref:Cytosolic carboxypeptidase 2 n=1 Tax=Macrostomum lignano TaxID=282301 RepID=A0A1I8HQD0_9PLAT